MEFRPFFAFMDIHIISALIKEIIGLIRRMSKIIQRILCGD
jgi:hypothetical protein